MAPPPPWWSKMELKKTFEGFLNVLNVLNMSHGNGSSAFVFQVTGILKLVTVSTDKGVQLSHSHIVAFSLDISFVLLMWSRARWDID